MTTSPTAEAPTVVRVGLRIRLDNTYRPAHLLGLDSPDQSQIGQEIWDDEGGAS